MIESVAEMSLTVLKIAGCSIFTIPRPVSFDSTIDKLSGFETIAGLAKVTQLKVRVITFA